MWDAIRKFRPEQGRKVKYKLTKRRNNILLTKGYQKYSHRIAHDLTNETVKITKSQHQIKIVSDSPHN
jgi:hypothetical protein